ncbi:MAG TPA: TIGR02679 domain-containing protein [Bacillota bacterium]|nr:TIGR02679 domain-containing protein [Bacillota bacterium]
MDLLTEAVNFFKSNKSYHVLFNHIRKKYESLGRIGGTIPTSLFSQTDLGAIGAFLGMPADKVAAKETLSILLFEEKLKQTKFASIPLKKILDTYFGEEIISKKQRKQEKALYLKERVQATKALHPSITFWFDHLLERTRDSGWIYRLVEMDYKTFEEWALILARSWTSLPNKPERLPLFAQRITGNPHAFDVNEDGGKLLLHLLAVDMRKDSESVVSMPTGTEGINYLLAKYDLYRDDVLNFVTCAGLLAEVDNNGGVHPVWLAASDMNTVLNMPLREITTLKRIYPHKGSHVWLVENAGVCSAILDEVPSVPIISTNGQFKLAALQVMDRLVKEDCVLHYAGDFDPEGLLMAQRLLGRYPDHVQLWRMDVEHYQQSEPRKSIGQDSLEKLRNITDSTLRDIADEMRMTQKAGYQEALVEQLVADVKI